MPLLAEQFQTTYICELKSAYFTVIGLIHLLFISLWSGIVSGDFQHIKTELCYPQKVLMDSYLFEVFTSNPQWINITSLLNLKLNWHRKSLKLNSQYVFGPFINTFKDSEFMVAR